ncbi:hypothetical protein K439DRAFT_1660778 [Ramaria rubella]|nr:hypothetical protein K439DRAFT_1660778 [Ramaria rubella]
MLCESEHVSSGTLTENLNRLLTSLSLPITLEKPYDLTPSLLIAILESILRDRLPISEATRSSVTPAAKVEAMKVFLGVLEDDVLQKDIGLSDIDPRKLAAGEWDEVVFVGKILCSLGRSEEHYHDSATISIQSAPPASSSGDTSMDTRFSRYDGSETTATTLPSFELPSVESTSTSRPVPRCIHELDVSSISFDTQATDDDGDEEICDCSYRADVSRDWSPPTPSPSVRYYGFIRPVKDEIEEFEAWQERTRSRSASKTVSWKFDHPTAPSHDNLQTSPQRRGALWNPTRHTSPTQYTLSLLNERARLLEKLARIKVAKVQGPFASAVGRTENVHKSHDSF